VAWACGETGLVKKFIVHRFDSLAKVVVSAVFQGSVEVFQKGFLIAPAACDRRFGLFGDSPADDGRHVKRRWMDGC
jgi:hypothetical protein